MLPDDDPRHGEYAGYVAHLKDGEQPCATCRPVGARRRKRNKYLADVGQAASIPALGTTRRIHALRARGFSATQIATESGIPRRTIDNLSSSRGGGSVYRATAAAIDAAFRRLCMAPAPTGRPATYNRTIARRNGWAPPLAWDDIDDPDASPNLGDVTQLDPQARRQRTMGRLSAEEMVESAEWLADADENLENACARLGVSREALWQTCRRTGRLDLYARLSRRGPDGEMALTMRKLKQGAA